jgi:cytidylate kinase
MVIAIDGPAGSGKSSTARAVAARLGIVHLDTGAMYRAVTLKALREGIDAADEDGLAALMKATGIGFAGSPPDVQVWLDGEDVSEAIRSDEVTRRVSDYCQPKVVRSALVEQQRAIGRAGDCVCEGRDIGTVVFPDAELKFFMTASISERARRRKRDFEELGVDKSLGELEQEIAERDRKDSSRELSPLVKARDAEELDTTDLTLEGQADYIAEKARQKLSGEAGE